MSSSSCVRRTCFGTDRRHAGQPGHLWATGLTGGVTLIICLGFNWLSRIHLVWFCLAALGLALGSGYNAILDGIQNASRQRAAVAWHQTMGS